MALRRLKSVVVFAGDAGISERAARAFLGSLRAAGIETVSVGREPNASRIAQVALDTSASTIEVCAAGGGVVELLRELLRELKGLDRADVGIVVHKVQ